MLYQKTTIAPHSPQETQLLEMCKRYFGAEPPYKRQIGQPFINSTLQEIRAGEVFCAYSSQGTLAGFLVLCDPALDPRISKYAKDIQSAFYLAVLIIDTPFRRAGHARALLQAACDKKEGALFLITPKCNSAAKTFYEQFGLQVIDEFDQQELSAQDGTPFNLKRIVMSGTLNLT